MHNMARRTLKELVKKWEKIFTEDLVESNIRLLKGHVQTFFNEILSETDRKEETILSKIESKLPRPPLYTPNSFNIEISYEKKIISGLRKEQAQLQRLLQVEKRIDLPQLPLLSFQLELDKNLEDLREELQSRKLQIKDLLLKQESLCNILEEPKMKLYEDPLSSAEDIEYFKENLTFLHNLKMEREKTLTKLRADILQLSHELDLPILEEPCHRFVAFRLQRKYKKKIINFSSIEICLQSVAEIRYYTVQVQHWTVDTIGA